MKQFTFPSSNGHTTIHGVIWRPDGHIKAVIQVTHGITEHMGRYQAMADFCMAQGYALAGHDQLGHGDSIDDAPMYFGPEGSWQHIVKDVSACTALLRREFPGTPVVLMGFSLGSFAARCLMNAAFPADALVLAGTGHSAAAEIAIARTVCRLEQRRFGDKTDTKLLHSLTMDTYNQRFKPNRTGADWLCANTAAVDAYIADEKCGSGFTVGSFRELLAGMEICRTPVHLKGCSKALPVLLISGGEDPVGKCGKGVKQVYAMLQRQGFTDAAMQLYPGMRHDIFRETDWQCVCETLLKWIEKHLPA